MHRFSRDQAQVVSLRKGLHAVTTRNSANQTQVLISERLMCFSSMSFWVSVQGSHATASCLSVYSLISFLSRLHLYSMLLVLLSFLFCCVAGNANPSRYSSVNLPG